MAVVKLNDFDIGDSNLDGIMETLTRAYRGLIEISISNNENDLEPAVKVGSVFDNKGSFFVVEADDIIPSGYDLIGVLTTFYLYYNSIGNNFIYSSVIPIWDDDYQGWYNGDNRALFSMFKDTTGTLYQDKSKLKDNSSITINGNIYSREIILSASDITLNSLKSGTVPLSPQSAEKDVSLNVTTKIKEYASPGSGTVKIGFDIKASTAGQEIEAAIYINGVQVGVLRTSSTTTYTTYEENIEIKYTDLIQIYGKRNGANLGYIRNFTLYSDLTESVFLRGLIFDKIELL